MGRKVRHIYEKCGTYQISENICYIKIKNDNYDVGLYVGTDENIIRLYDGLDGCVTVRGSKFLSELREYINMGPRYSTTRLIEDCDLLFNYITLASGGSGVGEYDINCNEVSQGDILVRIISRVDYTKYHLHHGGVRIKIRQLHTRYEDIEFAKGLIAKYRGLHPIVKMKSARK